jgi:hypothetical protein
VAFEGAVFRLDDLPDHVAHALEGAASGPLAAGEVDTRHAGARHTHGREDYHQAWKAWRATRDGIAVAELRRPLTRLGESKRFAPTGELLVDAVTFYPGAGVPDRRRGRVPTGASHDDSRCAGESGPGWGNQDAEGGVAYLPPVVAAELRTAVPDPTYSHARIWQWWKGDRVPYRHELVLLLMGHHGAVVLTATQEPDSLPAGASRKTAQAAIARVPWEITRYHYRLAAPRAGELSSGADRARLAGGRG